MGRLVRRWVLYLGRHRAHRGARYDPVGDAWRPLASWDVPSSGYAQALWTGEEVVVQVPLLGYDTLARAQPALYRYDPVADAWADLGFPDNVYNVFQAGLAWTGTELLAFGTSDRNAAWSPEDGWRTIAQFGDLTWDVENAPAVWTGDRFLVWVPPSYAGEDRHAGFGGLYDPVTDAWEAMSDRDAPDTGVSVWAWTGSELLVFGANEEVEMEGAAYDPATDTWRSLSSRHGPEYGWGMRSAWTGDRLIVWGGDTLTDGLLATGAVYDPAEDAWTPIAEDGAPSGRSLHTLAWVGDRAVVWGGGGICDPPVGDGAALRLP